MKERRDANHETDVTVVFSMKERDTAHLSTDLIDQLYHKNHQRTTHVQVLRGGEFAMAVLVL